MDKIKVSDLEVFYRVGVPEEERAQPQRLLLTVEMSTDFTAAALSDRVAKTIDYFSVCQFLLKFGDGRNWRLIETLASELASETLAKFKPHSITVEVKKFIIPQARFVSVTTTRPR